MRHWSQRFKSRVAGAELASDIKTALTTPAPDPSPSPDPAPAPAPPENREVPSPAPSSTSTPLDNKEAAAEYYEAPKSVEGLLEWNSATIEGLGQVEVLVFDDEPTKKRGPTPFQTVPQFVHTLLAANADVPIHLLVDAPQTSFYAKHAGRPVHALYNNWSEAWLDAHLGTDASPLKMTAMCARAKQVRDAKETKEDGEDTTEAKAVGGNAQRVPPPDPTFKTRIIPRPTTNAIAQSVGWLADFAHIVALLKKFRRVLHETVGGAQDLIQKLQTLEPHHTSFDEFYRTLLVRLNQPVHAVGRANAEAVRKTWAEQVTPAMDAVTAELLYDDWYNSQELITSKFQDVIMRLVGLASKQVVNMDMLRGLPVSIALQLAAEASFADAITGQRVDARPYFLLVLTRPTWIEWKELLPVPGKTWTQRNVAGPLGVFPAPIPALVEIRTLDAKWPHERCPPYGHHYFELRPRARPAPAPTRAFLPPPQLLFGPLRATMMQLPPGHLFGKTHALRSVLLLGDVHSHEHASCENSYLKPKREQRVDQFLLWLAREHPDLTLDVFLEFPPPQHVASGQTFPLSKDQGMLFFETRATFRPCVDKLVYVKQDAKNNADEKSSKVAGKTIEETKDQDQKRAAAAQDNASQCRALAANLRVHNIDVRWTQAVRALESCVRHLKKIHYVLFTEGHSASLAQKKLDALEQSSARVSDALLLGEFELAAKLDKQLDFVPRPSAHEKRARPDLVAVFRAGLARWKRSVYPLVDPDVVTRLRTLCQTLLSNASMRERQTAARDAARWLHGLLAPVYDDEAQDAYGPDIGLLSLANHESWSVPLMDIVTLARMFRTWSKERPGAPIEHAVVYAGETHTGNLQSWLERFGYHVTWTHGVPIQHVGEPHGQCRDMSGFPFDAYRTANVSRDAKRPDYL
jgi:hypothetical protein